MDKENSLAKDIEELVNKSIEANKVFLNESSRIVRGFATPGEKKVTNIFQGNLLSDALSAYSRLNIQYLKNVMDLSVSMIKNAGVAPGADAATQPENEETTAPSFVLEAEAEAGGGVSLSFLLDNIKTEVVFCNLVCSPYILNAGAFAEENFITDFSPQSFRLNPGEQKRIQIDIAIPGIVRPGAYTSRVKVEGFDPAYFSIRLNVKEQIKKTATNARKKAGRKK